MSEEKNGPAPETQAPALYPEFRNAPPLTEPMFMAVYAGPDVMSGRGFMAGQFFASENLRPQKTCEFCGKTIPEDSKFCSYCGKEQPVPAFCAVCGAKLLPSDKFCRSCGGKR